MPTPGEIILWYFVLINAVTFLLYGFDKYSARKNIWRISEATLWSLALIGGSIGALLAMNQFRHKTRKLSFQLVLGVIIAIQAAIIYALYTLDVIVL